MVLFLLNKIQNKNSPNIILVSFVQVIFQNINSRKILCKLVFITGPFKCKQIKHV